MTILGDDIFRMVLDDLLVGSQGFIESALSLQDLGMTSLGDDIFRMVLDDLLVGSQGFIESALSLQDLA